MSTNRNGLLYHPDPVEARNFEAIDSDRHPETILSEALKKRLGRSKLDLYHLKTMDQTVESRHRSRALDLAQCWLTVNTSAATGADSGVSPPLKWSNGGARIRMFQF